MSLGFESLFRRRIVLQQFLRLLYALFEFALDLRRKLAAVFLYLLFNAVSHIVELIAGFRSLFYIGVFGRVQFGFLAESFDFLFAQAARICNGYLLLLACGFILRAYVQYAVCVYVECDLNLRQASRSGIYSVEPEIAY